MSRANWSLLALVLLMFTSIAVIFHVAKQNDLDRQSFQALRATRAGQAELRAALKSRQEEFDEAWAKAPPQAWVEPWKATIKRLPDGSVSIIFVP